MQLIILHQSTYVILFALIKMVRLFVHVKTLIFVYYVFHTLSKKCTISFFERSFMHAAPTLWNTLDLDIIFFPFDAFKKESISIFI